MNIIPVSSYDCITYEIEDEDVVIYGMKDGKVIQRHVVGAIPSVPQDHDKLIAMCVIAVCMTFLVIMSILLGYPDVAQHIVDFALHIFTKV